MRYALLIHYPQPANPTLTEDEIKAGMAAFQAYATALEEAKVLRSAEVLQTIASATSVSTKQGALQVQDGPFADTKEAFAGIFMLLLAVLLGDIVARIPMAALVAVMIVVSATTFDWHSIRPSTLKMMPKSETFVMAITVALTVVTSNLAIGVGAGILAAMVLFANRVAHMVTVDRSTTEDSAVYKVNGELFFASSNDLYMQFDYAQDPEKVIIDMSDSHLWDASTVAALDSIRTKYAHYGKSVEIQGLNEASQKMQDRLGGKLG